MKLFKEAGGKSLRVEFESCERIVEEKKFTMSDLLQKMMDLSIGTDGTISDHIQALIDRNFMQVLYILTLQSCSGRQDKKILTYQNGWVLY